MDKNEIKALISAKIAGQGSMVDVGGALPTILDAILDIIPEGGGEPYTVQGAELDIVGAEGVLTVPEDEYARAKEAFLAGRIVFIPKIDHVAYIVTGYADDIIGSREGLCLSARSSEELSGQGANIALLPKSEE